jgi:excisionase family DNA binding protein
MDDASHAAPPVASGWYNIHEVAKRQGVTTKTIRVWCRTRGLRYAKIGGCVYIHEYDLDQFFRAHCRGGNIQPGKVSRNPNHGGARPRNHVNHP